VKTLSEEVNKQMIQIPEGLVSLREGRTNRQWNVAIRPFFISRFLITQKLYARVTGLLPSSFTCEKCPVENVSWIDAVGFCNQLSKAAGLAESYEVLGNDVGARIIPNSDGFRLPSEAEWEYACRAGTQGPRYGELDQIAWYSGNSDGHIQPIGLKQPNAWGLYDMLGNVWEWCSDQYDPEVYGSYRIFRGGGWADHERGCLATNRRRSHPTFKIDDLGFRIVLPCHFES
jgi:formylglycine-generating enzyme required for sulfatase activity